MIFLTAMPCASSQLPIYVTSVHYDMHIVSPARLDIVVRDVYY